MKRILAAIGWTIGLQVLWGAVQVALIMLLVEKLWIGDNFLAANYRKMSGQVSGLTDDIITAMLNAAAITFIIGVVASLLWVVIGGCHRIYGPGQAARLRLLWVLFLILGILGCGGATYFLIDNTGLVPLDGMVKLVAASVMVFIFSYYVVGTLWPTPRKIRPAVPLGRLLPVG